jgi:hypothetical protein
MGVVWKALTYGEYFPWAQEHIPEKLSGSGDCFFDESLELRILDGIHTEEDSEYDCGTRERLRFVLIMKEWILSGARLFAQSEHHEVHVVGNRPGLEGNFPRGPGSSIGGYFCGHIAVGRPAHGCKAWVLIN